MPQDQIQGGGIEIKETYVKVLMDEIRWHHQHTQGETLRTVYIGGGTPLEIGAQKLIELIDLILELRGHDTLEELSIELNPNPSDEVLATIQEIHTRYPHLFRIRRSIGIQTLDDKLLTAMKR
jgi:oxygen-independent coproporphyrinogen III oxidase